MECSRSASGPDCSRKAGPRCCRFTRPSRSAPAASARSRVACFSSLLMQGRSPATDGSYEHRPRPRTWRADGTGPEDQLLLPGSLRRVS